MRCVVWTGVYAAGFLQVRAKIAGGCLLLDDRLLAAGILRIVRKNFEGMQIDIAVGAIPRAEPAADAPILDDDFERIAATDGANGAPDHAKRVAALAATRGHEIALKAQPVAHQTCDAVMRFGAGVYASIAACAVLQIEDEQALRFHQTLRKELVNGDAVDPLQALLISRAAFGSDGFKTGSHARKFRNHVSEIVAADPHKLETVCRVALLDDHLPRREPLKLDTLFEMPDKLRRQIREHGHAAKVVFKRAAAVSFI